MTAEERHPIPTRLIAPPPVVARLVRPPRRSFRALLPAALRRAATLPAPWALLALARIFRALAVWAPFVVVVGFLLRVGADEGHLLRGLLLALTRLDSLLPAFGLGLALLLFAALLEPLAWFLGLPLLAAAGGAGAGGTAPAGVGTAPRTGFAGVLATGALLLVAEAILCAAGVSLAAVAGTIWLRSLDLDGAAPILGAASGALVATLVGFAFLFFRAGREAAIAQAGALGKGPFAAIRDGFALVLRRPGFCIGTIFAFFVAEAAIGQAIWTPAGLAHPNAAGVAAMVLAQLLTFACGGYLALARLGLFAGAAVDEELQAAR